MASVLVLGSTGRLGRLLRQHWPAASAHHIRWHGRTPPADPLFDIMADPNATRAAIEGADILVMLAGSTPASHADLEDNVTLTRCVLEASGNKPVLIASSAAVYGRAPCVETSTLEPVSDYGRVKQRVEEIALRHPAAKCILRIGNVVGADALLSGGREVRRLHVFADGRSPERSYISPAQLAAVMEMLVTRIAGNRVLPEILNIACPRPVFMAELLEAAGLSWTPVPAPPGVIRSVVLNTDRLGALFAFAPDASQPDVLVRDWQA